MMKKRVVTFAFIVDMTDIQNQMLLELEFVSQVKRDVFYMGIESAGIVSKFRIFDVHSNSKMSCGFMLVKTLVMEVSSGGFYLA
jgi:hypothetical protein